MMSEITVRRHRTPSFWFVIALALAIPMGLLAQGAGGGRGAGRGAAPAGAPPALGGPAAAAPAQQGPQGRGGAPGGGGAGARGTAPVDLTGTWVSIVTEDWVERMCPDCPPSGTPQSARGGRGGRGGPAAGAAGAAPADPCRAYGAGGSMRMPGRLNISWADDNTMKVDMDQGTQTRLFHFGAAAPPTTEKTLQGYSTATWDTGGGGGRGGGRGAAPTTRWGSLNVTTTGMKSGYLLSNRSTYSENATMTEYFIRSSEFGEDHITVVAIITDPGGRNVTTSSTFKKEPDNSKFSPTGCDIVK